MEILKQYIQLFEQHLTAHPLSRPPYNLYEPADYILSLGGKRLRPVFVLLGCDLYGGEADQAMNAAMAVEIFHNFTLLHDDIMDKAELRRGKPTVHVKFNTNAAILSGDAMMIQAYQYILNYGDPVLVKSLLDIFNKMAFEVCEGQQMDMDFEQRQDVNIAEYIEMISLKTSVLIGACMQMGALVGGASVQDQEHLYNFAKNFGIAFQLQDDILDTFGDGSKVGKKIGGDILQNKKTYLFLKSLELADDAQKDLLSNYYFNVYTGTEEEKIKNVRDIFKDVNVLEYSRQVIEAYRDLAVSHLNACVIDKEKITVLTQAIDEMIYRNS